MRERIRKASYNANYNTHFFLFVKYLSHFGNTPAYEKLFISFVFAALALQRCDVRAHAFFWTTALGFLLHVAHTRIGNWPQYVFMYVLARKQIDKSILHTRFFFVCVRYKFIV